MINSEINCVKELTWSEVRDDVAQVNPELAAIIDELNPSKKYKLIKATYSFGDPIIKDGITCLPDDQGKILPLTNPSLHQYLKDELSYSSIPLLLTLKKSNEVFIDTGSRIIPLNLFNPGSLLGLFEVMDFTCQQPSDPKWCVSAGGRSIFMLPKISETSGIKRLRSEYGLSSDIRLKYLSDHWAVFRDIANHQNFTQDWRNEILFFTQNWFNNNKSDPAWFNFYKYLFKNAWQQAKFAINKFELGLCWEAYIKAITSRNLKPNVYLTDQLRHIISIAAGMSPGFRPADTSQQVLPSEGLHSSFVNVYMLKEYFPTLMHASYLFSEEQNSLPVYYSLYFPAIAEGSPYNNCTSTIMFDIRTMKLLLDTALHRTNNESSRYNKIIHNSRFDYFHVEQDKFNEIQESKEILNEDLGFISHKTPFTDRSFCSTGAFWRGCIRIWPSKSHL